MLMFQDTFNSLKDLVLEIATKYPISVVIGALLFGIFMQVFNIRACIEKHTEYIKTGARVYVIMDNKRDLYNSILYATLIFAMLLLLVIVIASKGM